jgi:serine/threonine protein kinase
MVVCEATGLLKITDFGSAVKTSPDPTVKHSSYVGTPGYRAPEIVLGSERYDHRVDLWSAGVVLTELTSASKKPVPIFGPFHINVYEPTSYVQLGNIIKVRNRHYICISRFGNGKCSFHLEFPGTEIVGILEEG